MYKVLIERLFNVLRFLRFRNSITIIVDFSDLVFFMKVSYDYKALERKVLISYRAEIEGRYKDGLISLRPFWDYKNPTDLIDLKDFSDKELYANLLLRCGALFGFYGFSHKETQEHSKNLLTLSQQYFSALEMPRKEASCFNYLSLSYWRKGEYKEARDFVDNAFSINKNNSIFLHSLIVEALINFSVEKYDLVSTKLLNHKYLFDSRNDFLSLSFNSLIGLCKKRAGEFDSSLRHFQRAMECSRKLNNRYELSLQNNNIARLFQSKREFAKAYQYAFKAFDIANENKNDKQIGIIYDTLAQISLDKNEIDLALYYSENAVETLRQTDAVDYLIEAMETNIAALTRFEQMPDALDIYEQAITIARSQTSKDVVERLRTNTAKLFSGRVLEVYVESLRKEGYKHFKINLPKKYANEDLVAVEITSESLWKDRIKKGDVVLVKRNTKLIDYQLIMVSDKKDKIWIGDAEIHDDYLKLNYGSNLSSRFYYGECQYIGNVIGYCKEADKRNSNVEMIEI